MNKADKHIFDYVGYFFIGMLVLFMIQSGFGLFNRPIEIKELAQSICDQEYNMDYESYDDGELTCKPKEIVEQEQYDGIVINIKEAR